MDPEITPEQKNQLASWADLRDSLLSQISRLRTEKETLEKVNTDLANSNTEIIARLNQYIGRIEELDKKERELFTKQSVELSNLKAEKAVVESDITGLKREREEVFQQKENLQKDICVLVDVFRKVDGQVSDLTKIVDHVTRVSVNNVEVFDTLMGNLKKTLAELIDVNTKNVFETNVVIEKLPQMLVEVRKQNLLRNRII